MTLYLPDRWELVLIKKQTSPNIIKVLGEWLGGYLSGNSWRLNSGICDVKPVTDDFHVCELIGWSGSTYRVNNIMRGLGAYGTGVFLDLKESVQKAYASEGVSVELLPDVHPKDLVSWMKDNGIETR